MATHTYTLYPTRSAVTDSGSPNSHYAAGSSADLRTYSAPARSGTVEYYHKKMLLGFEVPANIANEYLTSIKLYVYPMSKSRSISRDYGWTPGLKYRTSPSSWNENSIRAGDENYMAWNYADANGNLAFSACSLPFGTLILNSYNEINIVPNASAADLLNCLALYNLDWPQPIFMSSPEEYSSITLVGPSGTKRPYVVITTTDDTPWVTDISPRGSYVDGSDPVTFRWTYNSTIAGDQKSYTLETSTDGLEWTVLSTEVTARTSYTANSIATGGILYWRVKVTNQAGFVSEYSDTGTLVVRLAPELPRLSVNSAPRPTLQWSAVGQQAYQVQIGSYDSGELYGASKSYKSPIYLPDGNASVGVRIKNTSGIWSDWSRASLIVANTPGTAIALTAAASDKVRLSWNGSGRHYVLRDGKPIASVVGTSYMDSLAIGKHKYTILRQENSDNYTLSNEITVTLRAPCAMMCAVDAKEWLRLRLSYEPRQAFDMGTSQQITYRHYSGRALPVAEISEFIDKSLSFVVVLKDVAEISAFEAMIGKTVCYKNRQRVIIGTLAGYSVSQIRDNAEYSATITAIDYEEEVPYA